MASGWFRRRSPALDSFRVDARQGSARASSIALLADRDRPPPPRPSVEPTPGDFTGRPCVNGHVAPRNLKNCHCLECDNKHTSARYWGSAEYRDAQGKARRRRRSLAVARPPYARAYPNAQNAPRFALLGQAPSQRRDRRQAAFSFLRRPLSRSVAAAILSTIQDTGPSNMTAPRRLRPSAAQ
jgi:hypothetical protein